jgi:hypothetical protein
MEQRITRLIRNLKTLDVDLKKQSIDELATLGNEHAEAALHWAMQNDLDEEIQQYARAAYEKLHANSNDDSEGGISISAPPMESSQPPQPKQPTDAMAHADIGQQEQNDHHDIPTAPADDEIDPNKKYDLNDTSHMAVLEEVQEEPRNTFGDLSLKLAALKVALVITLLFLEAPYDSGEVFPLYVKLVDLISIITPFAGIIAAVFGLLSHSTRKFTAQAGLALNGFFAFIWLITLITK